MALKACGCEISFVNHHRYLGLILDSTMSLGPVTKDIKKRITNTIFMFRKIRKFLTFEASIVVYKQTVHPIIDYAGFLLISCNKEERDDFQKLQNDILRICNKLSPALLIGFLLRIYIKNVKLLVLIRE